MLTNSDHRPGFAKRPQNFGKIVAKAEGYTPEPMSRDEIGRAILFGMPDLAPAEAKLLQLYLAFLGREDLLSGRAFVYPSNRLICAVTRWGPSTLRRHRQALEHKGLIIRNLNRANRPAHMEAIDLRPLLASIREAQDAAEAVFEAHRAHVEHVAGSDVYDEEKSAHPLNSEHLIQSQPYQSESVTNSAPSARLRSQRPAAKRPVASNTTETAANTHPISTNPRAKIRLETRRVGSSQSKNRATITDEQARSEVAAAIDLAPSLAPYFEGIDFHEASMNALVARAGDAVAGLFPERNTASHTWTWAVRRHGWRAILGLVAALADPTVRDRYGFLGWISKTPGVDFATNLRRAAEDRVPATPQVAGSPAKDFTRTPEDAAVRLESAGSPVKETQARPAGLAARPASAGPLAATLPAQWAVLLARLTLQLGKPAVQNWLAQLVYHGIEAGTLHLTASGAFVRDRVRMNYLDAIEFAAKAEGLPVARVEISLARS